MQLLGSRQAQPAWQGRARRRASARSVACAAAAGPREVLTPAQRAKLNSAPDREFYAFPRLVKHVDDGFLEQVTELYAQRVPQGGVVLDLMSSWVSHLPPAGRYAKVIGHGLNAAELARNSRLDSFFVRDLNAEPRGWALADDSVDAVLCCVSVQYLQQPEAVFAEVHRVLKPGGVFILTFSNRLFYDKAIAAWRDNTGFGRRQLVASYFRAVEGFSQPELLTRVDVPPERRRPPSLVDRLAAALPAPLGGLLQRGASDPFNAVLAYKTQA